jgi:hypothetical protein
MTDPTFADTCLDRGLIVRDFASGHKLNWQHLIPTIITPSELLPPA